ncbi:hypothetical protein FRC11_001526, partial [Ceratobasidium sp. 423]
NMLPGAHAVAQVDLAGYTTQGSNIPHMASTPSAQDNMLGLQFNTPITNELPTHSIPVTQENPLVHVAPIPATPGAL